MKILLLNNRWAFPPNDGGTVAMYQLACGLKAIGYELSVFALNPSRSAVDINKVDKKYIFFKYTLVNVNTDLSSTSAFISLLKNKSYHAVRFDRKEAHEALEELLKKEIFDLVIIDSIYMSSYLATIRKFSSAKVVLRVHNVEHEIWEGVAREEMNLLKKLYIKILAAQLKKFEIQSVNSADALITLSESDLEFFGSLPINLPILASPTGIDFNQLKHYENISPEADSLFHIAAMDWQPNIQGLKWFIEHVWPIVYKRNDKAKLYIAGKKMPKELTELKLERLYNEGFVENAFQFMASKKIMIVPLFSGSGIRIKIIEAMAMRKAIVATSKAVQGLDLIHNIHLLIADTPESFAMEVIRLLNEEELYSQLSNAAFEYAKDHFDLYKNSKIMDAFFGKVLNS